MLVVWLAVAEVRGVSAGKAGRAVARAQPAAVGVVRCVLHPDRLARIESGLCAECERKAFGARSAVAEGVGPADESAL